MTVNNISTSGGLISTSYQIIDNIVSKQCYQYKHGTNRWLTHIDPCTSGLTRNTGGELSWFNGQQFPDGLMKPAKRKAPMTQIPVFKEETTSPPPLPAPPLEASPQQRFSALAAKYE